MSWIRPDDREAEPMRRPKRDVEQPGESDDAIIRLIRDKMLADLALAGFSPRKIAGMIPRIGRVLGGAGSQRHVTRRVNAICKARGVDPPWRATSNA